MVLLDQLGIVSLFVEKQAFLRKKSSPSLYKNFKGELAQVMGRP